MPQLKPRKPFGQAINVGHIVYDSPNNAWSDAKGGKYTGTITRWPVEICQRPTIIKIDARSLFATFIVAAYHCLRLAASSSAIHGHPIGE
jgi:hypothetical protein